jgi:hypothetical protein
MGIVGIRYLLGSAPMTTLYVNSTPEREIETKGALCVCTPGYSYNYRQYCTLLSRKSSACSLGIPCTPGISKGKWTPEEGVKLAKAVAEHGDNNWVSVAEMVLGRTNYQCRRRWVKN